MLFFFELQDPSKGYESESKDRNTETGVHAASIVSYL